MTDRRVVAYVPDLMDRSKVSAAAPSARFVATVAELATASVDADVVVIDLSRPGVLEALPSLAAVRTIAFCSHVDADLMAAATAAGAGEVLPRSRFFAGLPELLA